jgi:hypothetical protein
MYDCACAVCSGDTTVACNSDLECMNVGAGTCTANGGGNNRKPNGCADLVCTDIGAEHGECMDPLSDVNYCDGQLRANGKPYITCLDNADCIAVDSVCDDGDCGDCTIVEKRSCYLDPIETQGVAYPESPVIAGTFCVPNTISPGINGASGQPGASRTIVQVDVKREY